MPFGTCGRSTRREPPEPPEPPPPPQPPEEANRELLVPLVRAGPEPHVGRRPLRAPLTMPAPTRSLTVADVHRFVDEQVFRTAPTDGRASPRVGIELEWLTVARDGTP